MIRISKGPLAGVVLMAIAMWCCLPVSAQQAQSPTLPGPVPSVEGTSVSVSDGGPASAVSAAAPRKADRGEAQPRRARARAAAQRTTVHHVRATSGHAAGGAAARAFPQAAFDPSLQNPIDWVDLPDNGQVMTLDTPDAATQVVDLLDAISEATDWNIVSSETLETLTVRVWVKKVTPAQLLKILRFHGIYYEFDEETKLLSVMTVEEHVKAKYGTIEKRTFTVRHAEVPDIETALGALKSATGTMIVDPRSGQIIVWDTPGNLTEMEEALARLDRPLEQAVFALEYIDADSIVESVQGMLSEIGIAHADPRSNTVIVKDLPSRQEQIGDMLDALDQHLETRTWTLNYIEPDVVEERLATLVPEEMGPVSLDEETHQISITAIPARLDEFDAIIRAWDVKPRQVQIEAYLVSASTDVARNLGINWHYFDERSGVPFAIQSGSAATEYITLPEQGERLSIGRLPYQVPFYNFWTGDPLTDADGNVILDPEFKGNRVSALLEFLDQQGEIRILASPRVTVLDGQEAVFRNTEDRPYQQGGYSVYGAAETTNPNFNRVIPLQVQFVTVGTVLEVTPRINDESNVLMEVSAENSDADNVTVEVGDQASTIPQKRESTAETSVIVSDKQTLVIGGLRLTGLDDEVDRVPVLGEIPLLGRLFKTTRKQHREREFLIFITPTIVDEFTQSEAARLAEWEEDISGALRHSTKPLAGRISDRVSKGENEIGVSIGQTGRMFSEGKLVTLEDLRQRFSEVRSPDFTTVVIRQHPDAPARTVMEVTEIAMELGLGIEFVEGPPPFVPARRPPG